MYRILVSTLLLMYLFNVPVAAQITFTAADLPQIGGKLVTASDTITKDIDPGPAGPNQSWDFSQLTAQDTLVLNVVDPAGTASAGLYPQANVALQSGDLVIYAQVTSDAVYNLGIAGDTFPELNLPIVLRYNPPVKMYELPTTASTNFTHEYSFTLTADGSIIQQGLDSVRLVQVTRDTVMADGYGTLTTPAGTFQALRLHRRSTSVNTISILFFGFWQEIDESVSRSEEYLWIAKETQGNALSISYDEEGAVDNIEWWLNPNTAVAPNAEFVVTDKGGGQFEFTDFSGNNPTSWNWDFGDNTSSTERNPVHSYAASGMYNVCLTVSNSAGSSTTCQEVKAVVTSTYALEREYGFRLYPNPATTGIELESKVFGQQSLVVRFFNPMGQEVHISRLDGRAHVDVQDWPAGLYAYSVFSTSGRLLGSGKLKVN